MPLVRRTRATLRSAELGFFGVVVYTRVQTPRRWGEPFNAGVLFLLTLSVRPLRTSCWIVGTAYCLFLLRGCWLRTGRSTAGPHVRHHRTGPSSRTDMGARTRAGQARTQAPRLSRRTRRVKAAAVTHTSHRDYPAAS